MYNFVFGRVSNQKSFGNFIIIQYENMNTGLTCSEKLNGDQGSGKNKKEFLKKALSLKLKNTRKELSLKNQDVTQTHLKQQPKQNYSSLEEILNTKDQKIQKEFEEIFNLGPKIGEGCHSSVFHCKEISTQDSYAVKVMKKMDRELFPSIRQTYQIMSKLKHENIVKTKLLYINEKVKTCYLVQEMCDYPNLGQYIEENQNLQPNKIANILRQLIKTIAFMHEEGACHRDIKPENIMYSPKTEKIKLVDFELARRLKYAGDQFQMFTKTGTLQYRAPEMFKALYDQRIDLWAIGVVAYKLFTGNQPFSGSYEKQIINKILFAEPDYGKCSSEQKELLQKLLSKNPEKRASASEVLSCKYFLRHSRESRIVCKTPGVTIRSPSAQKQAPQKLGKNSLGVKNRFYDDDVTNMFLGVQQECGIVRFGKSLTDTDTDSPF